MKYRNWKIPYTAPQPPEALLRAGYSPLLAVLLALRGYADPGQARAFLSGGDQSVFDPMLLQDMDKAVARIRAAIERRENVAVFGDYDVDGITSTCVLTDYLRRRGVPVHPYIPDRIEEGYGLNMDAITSLQRADDITLIITVDCGITAIDETNYALQRGIDMVITDHHECSGQAIPNAVAVVDPKRPGSEYPNSGLAGVGVAYKLLCALEGGSEQVLRDYGDLVAIGTVADVMPLTGENRYLVAQGLAQINARPRPGIRALLHECGAEGRPVTATTIGFTLAPRINAAGRLGKTAVAALLLLTQDGGEADRYAAGLCQLNRERQALEQQIWEEASAIACRYPPRMPLVLASDTWHQGVIGIVCSRLCDRYGCPVVLISIDSDGIGKGSGRSIGSFNLFDALTSCSDLLDRYGGHALAAGLTIDESNIDALKARLKAYAETHVTRQQLIPQLHIDCMVEKEWLTIENIEGLSMLEPYGMQNAEPVFCMKDLIVEDITPLSSDRHVRLSLSKDGTRFNAIWFGTGAGGLGFVPGSTVDAAFHLEINEYHNRRSVQLVICDVQLSECEHRADQLILNLYNILMQDGPLTALEARRLLPERKDLVAVWRHIVCRAEDGRLSVPDGALSRRVSWESRREINIGKLLVSLDVFSESGLISYHFKEGMINVCLKPYEGKADISGSVVLRTLQSMAG